jgi:hypothetical protein
MDIRVAAKSVEEREEAGTLVHLKDESGEKQYFDKNGVQAPVTIKVAGTYSKRYRRATDANRDRLLKRRSIDGDQVNEQALATIAACIIEWDGLTAAGQPFPFSKENAMVLLDTCPWIREQVETAMNDHAVFSKAN